MNNLLTKTTWYSQALAIVLFIAVMFIGFYIGREYQKILDGNISDAPTTVTK